MKTLEKRLIISFILMNKVDYSPVNRFYFTNQITKREKRNMGMTNILKSEYDEKLKNIIYITLFVLIIWYNNSVT